jgi:hypothetical protein
MHQRRQADSYRIGVVLDLIAKTAVAVLIVFALFHQDWARFSDKAMTARAVAYPVLIGSVAAVWAWRRRRRPVRYPAAVAVLVTMPFLVDLAGNALDLYDRIDWFDDACHFTNWATLTAAVGVAVVSNRTLSPIVVAALCIGFGATTAILWEIAEFGAFVTKTPERYGLYHDTIGDLALGLLGATVAGTVCAAVGYRQRGRPALTAATPAPATPVTS